MSNEVPSRDALRPLPRWAIVAFAARCARRVEPIFRQAWPSAPRDLQRAVADAVTYTERCAAQASAPRSRAKQLALEADCASTRAGCSSREISESGAYSAAHAAANAVGAVAYPEEIAAGAYYAAVDAADALQAFRGEDPAAIQADFQHLMRSATEGGWTDDTPVPPDAFPRLPDPSADPQANLSEDEAAKLEAYHDWEGVGRPELSPKEQARMYYEALDRIRRRR